MKALILSAGLGTRLLPLTLNRPKALVEAGGITLIERAIRKLAAEGFDDIIVNVHHYAGMVMDFLSVLQLPDCRLTISDESSELLDTGGGVKKAEWFFGQEPFLVYNVDVATHLDLGLLYRQHLETGSLATLAVSRRHTTRYLLFDSRMQMRGWENKEKGELLLTGGEASGLVSLAFSGIQVLSPRIFDYMPPQNKFSLISLYLTLCDGHLITGYDHSGTFWMDLGKPESLRVFNDGIESR